MNKTVFGSLVLALLAFFIVSMAAFRVDETEQVILTQFGKPVGAAIADAGLKFKVPFIQTVNRIDKRILLWDGPATDMPTKDKLYITVDTFARRVFPVPARSRNLLAVGPGQRQLTCTPVPRDSSHNASENERTNAFDA